MSKILALLTLASFHQSKDVSIQHDFNKLHSQISALTSGLLDNVNNQSEYLKINKKDIEDMLAKTSSIKTSSSPQKRRFQLGKKKPSFRCLKSDIVSHREILATAMKEHNNPIAAE